MSALSVFFICVLVFLLIPVFVISSGLCCTAGTAGGCSTQCEDFTCGQHSGFSCADASGTDNCTCNPSS